MSHLSLLFLTFFHFSVVPAYCSCSLLNTFCFSFFFFLYFFRDRIHSLLLHAVLIVSNYGSCWDKLFTGSHVFPARPDMFIETEQLNMHADKSVRLFPLPEISHEILPVIVQINHILKYPSLPSFNMKKCTEVMKALLHTSLCRPKWEDQRGDWDCILSRDHSPDQVPSYWYCVH